jgi:hypothetical protein
MKKRRKKYAARRFKASASPIVIHINGLYIEADSSVTPLLDFVRMITHSVSVKGEAK